MNLGGRNLRNASIKEETGSKQRGSTMDVRNSQTRLLVPNASGHSSTVGFEKRILKGGRSIMQHKGGDLRS